MPLVRVHDTVTIGIYADDRPALIAAVDEIGFPKWTSHTVRGHTPVRWPGRGWPPPRRDGGGDHPLPAAPAHPSPQPPRQGRPPPAPSAAAAGAAAWRPPPPSSPGVTDPRADAVFRAALAHVRAQLPPELSGERLRQFLATHGAALREQLAAQLAETPAADRVPKGTALWPLFAAQGAPQPGERGYRPPHAPLDDLAAGMLDRALALLEAPEFFWAWSAARRVLGVEAWWTSTERDPEEDAVQADELLWMVGVPARLSSRRLRRAEQLQVALEVTQVAMEVEGRALARATTRAGQPLARYVGVGLLADHLAPLAPLRLVNVGKAEAAAFVEAHHSSLPCLNPRGLMYAIGAEVDGRLVAVATAGSPTGRWQRVPPRNVLELTRLASDGTTPHAASMLVARLLDLRAHSRRGRPDEPALFVTYQLSEAEGAVYRALADKGLRRAAKVKGRAPGGARGAGTTTPCQRRTGVTTALSHLDKYRWEAAA